METPTNPKKRGRQDGVALVPGQVVARGSGLPALVPLLEAQMQTNPLAVYNMVEESKTERCVRMSSPGYEAAVTSMAMASLEAEKETKTPIAVGAAGAGAGSGAGASGNDSIEVSPWSVATGMAATLGRCAGGCFPGSKEDPDETTTGFTLGIPTYQHAPCSMAEMVDLVAQNVQKITRKIEKTKGMGSIDYKANELEVWPASHDSSMLIKAGAEVCITSAKIFQGLPACVSGEHCVANVISGGPEDPKHRVLAAMMSPRELDQFRDVGYQPPTIRHRTCILCHRSLVGRIIETSSIIYSSTDRARVKREGAPQSCTPLEHFVNEIGPGQYKKELCYIPNPTCNRLKGPIPIFNTSYLKWVQRKPTIVGARDTMEWHIDQDPMLDTALGLSVGTAPPGSFSVPFSCIPVFSSTSTRNSRHAVYATVAADNSELQKCTSIVLSSPILPQQKEEEEEEEEVEPELKFEPEVELEADLEVEPKVEEEEEEAAEEGPPRVTTEEGAFQPEFAMYAGFTGSIHQVCTQPSMGVHHVLIQHPNPDKVKMANTAASLTEISILKGRIVESGGSGACRQPLLGLDLGHQAPLTRSDF